MSFDKKVFKISQNIVTVTIRAHVRISFSCCVISAVDKTSIIPDIRLVAVPVL